MSETVGDEINLDEDIDNEDVAFLNGQPKKRNMRRSFLRKWLWSILLNVLCIAIYTGLFFGLLRKFKNQGCAHQTQDETLGINVKHTPIPFHSDDRNAFSGPPTPQIDASWNALLEPMNMRFTADELATSEQSSVDLPGGGSLAWLGVFHELHCIKMLREWNYRSFYHPHLSRHEHRHMAVHADHCFEHLRQAAMCHGDLSFTTFVWTNESARPMFDVGESVHQCRDWGALVGSAEGRVVGAEEMGGLENPLMERHGGHRGG